MTASILATTLLISIDALFVGMSLRFEKGFRLYDLFIIAAVIGLVSLGAHYLTGILAPYVSFETKWLIAAVFALLGLRNLLEKDGRSAAIGIGSVLALGLVMSLDCAITTVALALRQGLSLWIPALIALFHLLFMLTGSFAAEHIKASKRTRNTLAAACMFAVAILAATGVL